ncbi:discoidin domain-containing protein [Paenibacillus sp. GD4]|uniref:discoidin domain-containing protein n=1 Tax=Paenibacillus sp. GD4 TaxID=3068890 RepID=UPI0027965E01|nr:discoidin domain-containing protein [Paenibacillus sp. GD4]MDQ1913394.1 discoidin domain-containing protein [Paenibacillus sp. GD4]
MSKAKSGFRSWLTGILLVSFLLPPLGISTPTATASEEARVNLALNKKVAQSSDCSCGRAVQAVDGDPATFWQPLSADRSDGTVWLTVDLGNIRTVDLAELDFRTGAVSSYSIHTSTDQQTWQEAATKKVTGSISGKIEAIPFPAATARYVRVTVALSNTNFQLNEFALYDTNGKPIPTVLESVYVADAAGGAMNEYDTIRLAKGESYPLQLGGKLSNGQGTDLAEAQITWESSQPGVAGVDPSGLVNASSEGVAKIVGKATLDTVTKESSVWVDVYDPAILMVDVQLEHTFMTREIGKPALLQKGDAYPSVKLLPYVDGTVTAALWSSADQVVLHQLAPTSLQQGAEKALVFPGQVQTDGPYEIRLTFHFNGKAPVYDTFYFTVRNPDDIDPNQSQIAFTGKKGRMEYVSDYRGNRIIDFSNAGYMGGGVKLPDVQARVVIEPGEGDDTARIQAAIDQVSQMPQSADGFRGAVLLKKGTYEIEGSLKVNASGVVLRGEGQEEDETVLYATGTTKRDLLQIRGEAPKLLMDTSVRVTDLFVPSGARSFHVEDASGLAVGDTVKVRRYGNARWIHEIDMDTIVEREGTQQWSPFNLDFDRVITAIDGQVVTIDAPLANSIEQRWGGGAVIKYEDPDRIEQIGIEKLRVVSAFDPSVTLTNGGKPYYADENHAVSFAVFSNVKNAWMREVTGLHLNHALAHVSRGSKWVTVQDNQSLDMVSQITGERRYPYKMSGELTLMQRNYAETARHAFVVDSRVQGPNVFLDSTSITEYATSEPHHRWSVGGLYDLVKSDIAVQDRGRLGSGHGWSGANYVTWNTEGDLVSQQPPTAQNYAIGHIGNKPKPYLPSGEDQRPRADAHWEHYGVHVSPTSLYRQQLTDRLGSAAVQNIERSPVGGGGLDTAELPSDRLPLLKGIKVNNKALPAFAPHVFDYTITVPAGSTQVPVIRPHDMRDDVEVRAASTLFGKTVLIVRDKKNAENSVRYNIRFITQ